MKKVTSVLLTLSVANFAVGTPKEMDITALGNAGIAVRFVDNLLSGA